MTGTAQLLHTYLMIYCVCLQFYKLYMIFNFLQNIFISMQACKMKINLFAVSW